MPVFLNEPLSFLQRLSENMEYYYLLDKADICDDPVQRIEYVASYAVASISSNSERLWKPFNPILGETYELVRKDLGFRIMFEQVTHDPSISAFYADSPHFIFSGSIHPKITLWLTYVEAKPKGILTLQLLQRNEMYTWSGITCRAKNILSGTLQIEQCGTVEITCHSNGLSVILNFKSDSNCVEGFVLNDRKAKLRFIYGKWNKYLKSRDANFLKTNVDVTGRESSATTSGSENINSMIDQNNLGTCCSVSSKCPIKQLNGSLEKSLSQDLNNVKENMKNLPYLLLWEAKPKPEYSSKYYNFSLFAMALNELQDSPAHLPPTDSRLRPDIRRLEEGDIDGATSERNRLEEKQHKARKMRNIKKFPWNPLWFVLQPHPYIQGEDIWVHKNNYWERNFLCCPDIFS